MTLDVDRCLQRARAHRACTIDPRLHEVLASAALDAPTVVRQWTATHGTMTSYALTLALTARSIALISRSMGLRDLLWQVLSAAVAEERNASLERPQMRWGRVSDERHGYRAQPSRPLDLRDEGELRRECQRFLSAIAQDPSALDGMRLWFDGAELALDPRVDVAYARWLAPLATSVRLATQR